MHILHNSSDFCNRKLYFFDIFFKMRGKFTVFYRNIHKRFNFSENYGNKRSNQNSQKLHFVLCISLGKNGLLQSIRPLCVF